MDSRTFGDLKVDDEIWWITGLKFGKTTITGIGEPEEFDGHTVIPISVNHGGRYNYSIIRPQPQKTSVDQFYVNEDKMIRTYRKMLDNQENGLLKTLSNPRIPEEKKFEVWGKLRDILELKDKV